MDVVVGLHPPQCTPASDSSSDKLFFFHKQCSVMKHETWMTGPWRRVRYLKPVCHYCSGRSEKSSVFFSFLPSYHPGKKSISIKIKVFSIGEESSWFMRRKYNNDTEAVIYIVGSCSVSGSLIVSITCLSFTKEPPTSRIRGSEFQAHGRTGWILTSAGKGPSPEVIPLSQILSKSCDLFSTDFIFFQLTLHIDIGAYVSILYKNQSKALAFRRIGDPKRKKERKQNKKKKHHLGTGLNRCRGLL